MSPRTHRRKAREVAMQAIFQLDQNPSTTSGDLVMFITESLKFPELEHFCKTLVYGTREHQNAIDQTLASAATNWKIDRMAAVDRAILRLCVFEMIFAPERTPVRVVISEAVEIAKRFSTNESARFVNGVLDRVARMNNVSAESPLEQNPSPDMPLPSDPDLPSDADSPDEQA